MTDIYLSDLVRYLARRKSLQGQLDLNPPKSEEENTTYDPDQKPPDFEMAKKHGKAKRVYKALKNVDLPNAKEICPCCGIPIKGERISLLADFKEIYHLGSGFVLFFMFIKYSIGLLMLIFAISGFYNIVTSSSSGDCNSGEDDSFCIQGFIGNLTIANKRNNINSLRIQLILNLSAVVAIIFFFHMMYVVFRKKAMDIDKETITPADFTVVLKGVPPSSQEDDILKWIKSYSTKDMLLEIRKIHRTYDIKKYIQMTKKKNALIKKRDEYIGKSKLQKAQNVQTQVSTMEQTLEEMKKNGFAYTPIVFVTFRRTNHAEYLSKKFKKRLTRKLMERIKDFWVPTKHNQLGEVRIKVQRAPEPSDVIWENLGYKAWRKITTRIFTRAATTIVNCFGFGIIILLYFGQNKAAEQVGEDSNLVLFLSIAASLIVLIVNLILEVIIKFFTQKEKFTTFTRYSSEIAKKLLTAQLVNTAMTPLLAKIVLSLDFSSFENLKKKLGEISFYGNGGILENMFYIFLINAIFPTIFSLFHPLRLYKSWKRKRALAQGDKANLTQQEANELFEECYLDISDQYVIVLKTMMLTAFYLPAMPIVVIFSIIGLFIFYWANKYLFLRKSALPTAVDDLLGRKMIKYMHGFGFMLALGNFIFLAALENSEGIHIFGMTPQSLIYITLGISFFDLMFPMHLLNIALFKINDNKDEGERYDNARPSFYTDYDIENPITRKTAIMEFMEDLKYRKRLPLIKRRSRSPSSVFDKIRAEDLVKFLHLDSLDAGLEHEKTNYDALDLYAVDTRRRTTAARHPNSLSPMEIKESRYKLDVEEHGDGDGNGNGFQISSEENSQNPLQKTNVSRQESLHLSQSIFKRGATNKHQQSFPPSPIRDPNISAVRELETVYESKEDKEDGVIHESETRILVPNTLLLGERKPKAKFIGKDQAEITKSENDESERNPFDFKINMTETPRLHSVTESDLPTLDRKTERKENLSTFFPFSPK